MRCPVAAIRQDCGLNRCARRPCPSPHPVTYFSCTCVFAIRISVSFNHDVLAVPQDNRHIRLYDLNGHRLAHLPHRNAVSGRARGERGFRERQRERDRAEGAEDRE